MNPTLSQLREAIDDAEIAIRKQLQKLERLGLSVASIEISHAPPVAKGARARAHVASVDVVVGL